MRSTNYIREKSRQFMASVGMGLSVICAIHCLATPFVLAFAPVFGSLISHESELYILGTSLLFASYVLLKDFKLHQSFLPIVIALLGATALSLGISVFHGTSVEFLVMSLGGFLMATSYYFNWRIGRKACIS